MTEDVHTPAELDTLPNPSVVQFRGPGLGAKNRLVWQLDEEWFSPGSTESVTSDYFPPEAFPAKRPLDAHHMTAAYLWGVATPIILGYIIFGIHIMVHLWSEHPSEHWKSQYRSPFAKQPLTVRSWTVFLALWIPTPLLWPVTVPIGKLLCWRYRHQHNTAAEHVRVAHN